MGRSIWQNDTVHDNRFTETKRMTVHAVLDHDSNERAILSSMACLSIGLLR